MKRLGMRLVVTGATVVALLIVVALAARILFGRTGRGLLPETPAGFSYGEDQPSAISESPEGSRGFLYGKVILESGAIYQGRLRFGGGEEAFWSDFFNGSKATNPWAADIPPQRLKQKVPLEVFGVVLWYRERTLELSRPFFVRFGEIERLEARGRELRVHLKSGRVIELDRYGADDLADGVRVWDEGGKVIDLDEWSIASIELMATPTLEVAASRLHGTVHTRLGHNFTGYIEWDRQHGLSSDQLTGRTAEGVRLLRFDTIRTIVRSPGGCRVILVDGGELAIEGRREKACASQGVFVDDARYGRVLVSWAAFERADFGQTPDSGPAYGDFRPGRPLTGTVLTRGGRRLTGQLVYDLDESETTDSFDAPALGVNFSLPFHLIGAISLPRGAATASVVLASGEQLLFEAEGDLGPTNAGLLVFEEGHAAEYVPWSEVEEIEFAHAPALSPPL